MRLTAIAGTLVLALLTSPGCGNSGEFVDGAQENDLNPDDAVITPPLQTEEYVDPAPPPGVDATLPNDEAQLAATVALLETGITTIAPGRALRTMEVWQAKLRSSGDAELENLSEDLAALQQAISSGNLDAATVGPLLVRIGEQTQAASSKAEANVAQQVNRLGTLLVAAGTQILPPG